MENAVEACNIRVEFGLPVVAFDLRGQGVPGESQALHERLRDCFPVSTGHGGDVRSVRARGAVDFAKVVGLGDPLKLAVYARSDDLNKDVLSGLINIVQAKIRIAQPMMIHS